MSKAHLKTISEDYALERVIGGVPIWPINIESNLAVFTIVDGLCNELEVVCPKPATPESLSASPGTFIPALKHILRQYDRIYWEHANAKQSSTRVLPRLFSIAPLPSFHWRSISMNANLLANLFTTVEKPECPAEYGAVFYQIFNFEQFGFDR
jgi:hypothetical protein